MKHSNQNGKSLFPGDPKKTQIYLDTPATFDPPFCWAKKVFVCLEGGFASCQLG